MEVDITPATVWPSKPPMFGSANPCACNHEFSSAIFIPACTLTSEVPSAVASSLAVGISGRIESEWPGETLGPH